MVESAGGFKVLVDPWLISPAFGAWLPSPHAHFETAKALIDGVDIDAVLVSHGHDDHLDDFLASTSLKDTPFLIPDIPSPGLLRRLKGLGVKDITQVDSAGLQFNDLRIHCVGNAEFSSDDAVLILADSSNLLIHANDNWREFNPQVLNALQTVLHGRKPESVYFLVQFGIADAYPWCYPSLTDSAVSEIMLWRLQQYERQIRSNMRNLGLTQCFTYANQSRYSLAPSRGCTPPNVARESFVSSLGNFSQLQPGDSIVESTIRRASITSSQSWDVLDGLVSAFAARANEYIRDQTTSSPTPKIAFGIHERVDSDLTGRDVTVTYVADERIWSEILSARLTFESISIGGAGLIYKEANTNISELHKLLTNWAYFAQNKLRNSGWRWLI